MMNVIKNMTGSQELFRNNLIILRRIFLLQYHSKIKRIAGYITDFGREICRSFHIQFHQFRYAVFPRLQQNNYRMCCRKKQGKRKQER